MCYMHFPACLDSIRYTRLSIPLRISGTRSGTDGTTVPAVNDTAQIIDRVILDVIILMSFDFMGGPPGWLIYCTIS